MARTNKILQSFNSGELSPLLDARIDQNKYQMGCRTLENFYPLIYGGAERRPGTYFIAEAKDSSVKCLVMDFIFSVDFAYILEIGNQYIRFYINEGRFVGKLAASTSPWADVTNYNAGDLVVESAVIYSSLITHISDTAGGDGTGGTPDAAANPIQWAVAALTSDSYPIYEIPAPYLTADLFDLKVEQSADVMYITHPDYEERKLSRISLTTFVLEELDYGDGPFQNQNTVNTALMSVSAVTGNGITVTASGTNKDGSTFQPFVDSTTAGHQPSLDDVETDANIGTSQTNKSITGALFKIVHSLDANEVSKTFTGVSTSDSLFIYKGTKWDFVTNGTWSGTIKLERSYDNLVWETLGTVISENNNNIQLDGTEETDDAYYRMDATAFTSGSANCQLSTRDSSHIGVVEITGVTSSTVATANVRATIGSTDTTHRWSEGYWSNFRGWPSAVTISPEERLTFAGSASFPLTVWGTKSGDFTDMTAGVLDDDAIIFTLVGTGRQNTIRWIVSKNSLLIGTYGGEHVLGASDENEAMTPTNVRAKVQSTYGSNNVQPIVAGDSVLFVQRGGRKIRQMHFDFRKDAQVSDDLTVFSNHITESTIVDMAYQRTPDPAIWAVRNDGQIANMSYERAQDIFSWCRLITNTNLAGTLTESDFESCAVIPSGSEEDIVYVVVNRTIGGGTKRMIEYFSSRDF